jgi:ABC-type amino acid transport substrate-binding protein
MEWSEIVSVQKERNTTMKTLSIAAVLAVASLSIAPAFASESVDSATIHGRSEFALVSALHDRGVVTTGVEAWGNLILAWVPNDNGGSTMVFFDPDNLQQVSPNRG